VWDRQSLSVDSYDRLYLGRAQHQIYLREALQIMHRDDLVEQYDHNQGIKRTMVVGGAVIGVGSIILATVLARLCTDEVIDDPTRPQSCVSNLGTVTLFGSLGVLGGIALGVAGLARNDEIVAGRELHTLVDDHNRALRARLLEAPDPGPAPSGARTQRTTRGTLQLSGWLRTGDQATGGLAVLGTF
jgi:hypothetical protein